MVAAEVHEGLANGLPDRNSGGSRGGLPTWSGAQGTPRRPWILSLSGNRASVSPQQRSKRATRRPPSLGFASRGVPGLHVREQVRQVLTRDEARHCQAQATSITVDTALAAELGDAWPLEQ
jgi:hypothetical protein